MRVARDWTGGEAVDLMGRPYLSDPELRRARDMAFANLRRGGYTARQIARLYNVSAWTVWKRLAQMPDSARRRGVAS
jgi:hypothetical protein